MGFNIYWNLKRLMSQSYATEPPPTGLVRLHLSPSSYGSLDIALFYSAAPAACSVFLECGIKGQFATGFTRVMKDVLIQCGDDSNSNSNSKPTHKLPPVPELTPRIRFNHRGQVALAQSTKSGDATGDADGSFFVTLREADWLNGQHVIFGTVVGSSIFNGLRVGGIEVPGDGSEDIVRVSRFEVVEDPSKSKEFEGMAEIESQKVVSSSSSSSSAGNAEAAKQRKKKRKGKKDFNVLSFGGDEEEQEQQQEVVKKKRPKIEEKAVEEKKEENEKEETLPPQLSMKEKLAAKLKPKPTPNPNPDPDPTLNTKKKTKASGTSGASLLDEMKSQFTNTKGKKTKKERDEETMRKLEAFSSKSSSTGKRGQEIREEDGYKGELREGQTKYVKSADWRNEEFNCVAHLDHRAKIEPADGGLVVVDSRKSNSIGSNRNNKDRMMNKW